MYALVEIKGKQYKAQEGDTLQVDQLGVDSGNELTFDTVVAVGDGENSRFGTPYVDGAQVTVTVNDIVKGKKIKVFKFNRRKGYRRTQGHREKYSMITVKKINA
ncbi:MAG: 50S ribosomal protein L21 [Sphaerochaetaceae bacterium]|nr:50S ribosomal protein L21 [Sphaerochaetaceae bacterium]